MCFVVQTVTSASKWISGYVKFPGPAVVFFARDSYCLKSRQPDIGRAQFYQGQKVEQHQEGYKVLLGKNTNPDCPSHGTRTDFCPGVGH